jgi:3',5'-cyclic AMP phosphodiesterase CpdA
MTLRFDPALRGTPIFLAMLLFAWAVWLGSATLAQRFPMPWQVRFAVLADAHLYAPALGQGTPAFHEHMAQEVKMLDRSVQLFTAFVDDLLARRPAPDFVLMPGDLTNEGERLSHELVIELLARFRERGIAVYVIPGNHDIANPEARGYAATGPYTAEGIDALEFKRMYADFGYARALSLDRHSLSYIAEPRPGLWLVAIDSRRPSESGSKRSDAGGIRPDTLAWLSVQMQRARAEGKLVLAMMHHGALEHFRGQGAHFPDLLIDDWKNVARQLAEMGLRLVFTGHGHAHDISREDWDDSTSLVDVETSSLVTYPNAYRWAELNLPDARLSLSPGGSLQREAGRSAGFNASSKLFSRTMQVRHVAAQLKQRTRLSADRQSRLAEAIADAIVANAAGDEQPTLQAFREALSMLKRADPDERAVGALLAALWHDLPPADHTLELNLRPPDAANPGSWYSRFAGRQPRTGE